MGSLQQEVNLTSRKSLNDPTATLHPDEVILRQYEASSDSEAIIYISGVILFYLTVLSGLLIRHLIHERNQNAQLTQLYEESPPSINDIHRITSIPVIPATKTLNNVEQQKVFSNKGCVKSAKEDSDNRRTSQLSIEDELEDEL